MTAFGVLHGNAIEVLQTLPAESVHCCITSPPYYRLRDYGTARWMGGSTSCDHQSQHGRQGRTGIRADRAFTGAQGYYLQTCLKCGARRVDEQIGLEPTPACYITRMVEVFAEVRRVLRNDGTCWLNMGDSYAGSWGACGHRVEPSSPNLRQIAHHPKLANGMGTFPAMGIKRKDLLGMPWMLAFALRASGWYLRQEIIWHKRNPMPESVRDRCTRAHETVFLLSKRHRYFYDATAIQEPASGTAHSRGRGVHPKAKIPAGWQTGPGSHDSIPTGNYRPKQNADFSAAVRGRVDVRNRRSVWSFSSRPSKEPHFATFPIDLPETCLLAGCPIGGVVLDPFAGIGTTGLAAIRHGRQFIGVELREDWVGIARHRLAEAASRYREEASA